MKKTEAGRIESVFEPLEPRILLSGSPAPEPVSDYFAQAEVFIEDDSQQEQITEVLFIDSGIDNYDNLFDEFDRNVEVIVIPEDENGVDFIASALEKRENIDAVHIFSHGNSDEIILGNSSLNDQTIITYEESLKRWGENLNEGADILIYGCNFGQSVELLSRISELTNADIAASDDLTGSENKGGDAELEVEVGNISVNEFFNQSEFNEADIVLAQPTPAKGAHSSWDANNSSQPQNSTGFPPTVDEGGDLGLVWNFDGSQAIDADDFEGAGVTTDHASFEAYFEPGNITSDGEYLIFETGGDGDGVTLWIERSNSGANLTLHLLVQHGDANKYFLDTDITGLSGFINAGITIKTGASDGQVKLYLNGALADTSSTGNLDKWSGSDDTSIGGLASGHATEGDGVSLQNFIGKIGKVNFYDSLLSADQMFAANQSIELSNHSELDSINEDLLNPDGNTIAEVLTEYFHDQDGDSLAGIAISKDNSNSSQGIWQYSTDDGSTWFNVGSVDYDSALLLASSDKLRFVPHDDYDGTGWSLNVNVVDSSNSLSFTDGATRETFDTLTDDAGTSPVSNYTIKIHAPITAVNDAPEFTKAASLSWDAGLQIAELPKNVTSLPDTVDASLASLGKAWLLDGSSGDTFSMDGFDSDTSDSDMSLEMWLKFDTSSADGNYYIYETGGDGRGLTLWLEKNAGVYTLHLHIQPVSDEDNSSKLDLTYDVSSLINNYMQVFFTIDPHSTAGEAKLYVNGELADEDSGVLPEWSGGDNTGIGKSAGSSASIEGDVTPVNYFAGEIALINFFNSLVKSHEIAGSYNKFTGAALELSEITYSLRGAAQQLISDISVRDIDSQNFNGGQLTVEVTGNVDSSNDTLTSDLDYSSFAILDGTSTNSEMIFNLNSSADSSAIKNLINSIKFNSDSVSLVDRIVTFSLTDGDSADLAQFTTTINIESPNSAPVLADASYDLTSLDENDITSAGQTVSSIVGSNISDSDIGDAEGIAITSITGNGIWQYKISSGQWIDLDLSNGHLHLELSDQLRYIPDEVNGEAAEFTFRAWDHTNGLVSGQLQDVGTVDAFSAYSLNERTATLEITAVNDAPALVSEPVFSFNADLDNGSQPLNAASLPSAKVDTGISALGQAWDFSGTAATADNFDGWNSDDASFEFWLKPDLSVANGNYLIFETGGTTHGMSLWINKSGSTYTIELLVKYDTSNNHRLSYELDGEENDYMQVGFSIYEHSTLGKIRMFVNGELADSLTALKLADWAGDDETSIGGIDGGYAASSISNLNMQNFTGQIAQINFYDSFLDSSVFSSLHNSYGQFGNASLSSVNEDTASPAGASVSSLISEYFGDVDDGQSLSGLAITADSSNTSEGVWQYSTDNGSNWYDVGSVSEASALTLSSSSLVRFLSAEHYFGQPGSLSVKALDSSDAGFSFTDGLTTEHLDTSTFTISSMFSRHSIDIRTEILSVNDTPEISAPTVIDVSDLSGWASNDNQPAGVNTATPNWNITGNSVYQSANSHPAVLYSDFTIGSDQYQGELNIKSTDGSDNDFYGFVLGYEPGGVSGTNDGFILIDWNRVTEDHDQMGLSNAGLAVSFVQGDSFDGAELWRHDGHVSEIARAQNLGNTGFTLGTNYNFKFEVDGDSLKIWVDDVLEFDLSTSDFGLEKFPKGHIGFYNLAQMKTTYEMVSLEFNGNPSVEFEEGGGAVAIAPLMNVLDVEQNYNSGTLTVEITNNADSEEDLLSTLYDYSTFAELDVSSTAQKLVFSLNALADSVNIKALAESVTFNNSSERPSLLTRDVTFTLEDEDGASVSELVNVFVSGQNDAPEVSATVTNFATDEEVPVSINGLSVSDIDAASDDIQLSLSVSNGTVTINNPNGGEENAANVVITGTVVEINAALANVVYTPNDDFSGSETLTVEISDLGSHDGFPLTDDVEINIQVNAISDAVIPQDTETDEEAAVNFTISSSDNDEGLKEILFTDVTDGTLSGDGLQDLGGGQYKWTETNTQPVYDLENMTINSHSDQDLDPADYIVDGSSIELNGNTWKNVDINYNITANTILSLEMKSTVQPELSMLVFDNDNLWSPSTNSENIVFYGVQSMSDSTGGLYKNYDGSGEWKQYTIRVGDHFTGSFAKLAFVNDDDRSGSPGNSSFRNVALYEEVPTLSADFTFTPNDDVEEDTEVNVTVTTSDAGDTLVNGPEVMAIAINPVNDKPLISLSSGDLDNVQITETDSQNLTAGGTLSVTDVDKNDVVTYSVKSLSASGMTAGLTSSYSSMLAMMSVSGSIDSNNTNGVLNWNFDSGSETFDYLAEGEVLTLDYTLQVKDDSGINSSLDEHVVTVTINGTNDTPQVSALNAKITEDFDKFSISLLEGALELDHGEKLSVENLTFNTIGPADEALRFELNDSGVLSLDPHQFNYLIEGEVIRIVFHYDIVDDSQVGAGDVNNEADRTHNSFTLTVVGVRESPPAESLLEKEPLKTFVTFEEPQVRELENVSTQKSFQQAEQKDSFDFLEKSSSLQFDKQFLSDDKLHVIEPIFHAEKEMDSEVAGDAVPDIKNLDKGVFDKPLLPQEDLYFIDDLRVEEDETDKDDVSDEFSYDSSADSLNELEEKRKVKDFKIITQYNLDEQLNLNESLVGDFDCFDSKADS